MGYTEYELYESTIGKRLRIAATVFQFLAFVLLFAALVVGGAFDIFFRSLIYGLLTAFGVFVTGLVLQGLAVLVDHAEVALLNDAMEREKQLEQD